MSDCSLYLVSPPRIAASTFAVTLERALGVGGIKVFQLRLKEADDEQILEAAREILPVCRKHDVAFILNDRPDLALRSGADGVHLGQEDMTIAEARTIIGPDAVIGVSCHASRDMAIDAAEAGADYVAFGAFFPTTSKPKEKIEKWGVPTFDIIEWWSTNTVIPCVAIGGMTPDNCTPLVEAGADFIAVITSVWNHPQGPDAGVVAFAAAINKVKRS
jgi:thiamine-phosphate pyrophosphorylase